MAESIERVRRVLAAGTPGRLSQHIAVQAALSGQPERGHAGTLYANWLLEPETSDELVEDIYMHTLPLAVFAAIQSAPTARVTWPQGRCDRRPRHDRRGARRRAAYSDGWTMLLDL